MPRNTVEVPQEQELETPPNEPLDTTLNTPEPVVNQVDPAILAAYQEELLTKSRRNAELERQLEESRKTPQRELTPDDEKAYFEKPLSNVRTIISEELAKQVKPINDFTAQLQRQNIISGFKQQMLQQSAQFPYIRQVENIFDQILNSEPVLDANSVIRAYNAALGYYISNGGSLTQSEPPTPPPNSNRTPVPPNPPHYKPAAPAPINKGEDKKKARELSENERKIARFNGMTEEEYIRMSDLPSSKVAGDKTPEVK